MSAAPAAASSSTASLDFSSASNPPARTATTTSVLNVGGHSAASSTPIRPAVPAPTYTSRPPPSRRSTTLSIAEAICGAARDQRVERRCLVLGHQADEGDRVSTVEVGELGSMLFGEQVGQVHVRGSASAGSGRIEGVAEAVAQQVQADDSDDDRRRRRRHQPPAAGHQGSSFTHHQPERGFRRLRAETEEAEARLGEDRPRQGERATARRSVR